MINFIRNNSSTVHAAAAISVGVVSCFRPRLGLGLGAVYLTALAVNALWKPYEDRANLNFVLPGGQPLPPRVARDEGAQLRAALIASQLEEVARATKAAQLQPGPDEAVQINQAIEASLKSRADDGEDAFDMIAGRSEEGDEKNMAIKPEHQIVVDGRARDVRNYLKDLFQNDIIRIPESQQTQIRSLLGISSDQFNIVLNPRNPTIDFCRPYARKLGGNLGGSALEMSAKREARKYLLRFYLETFGNKAVLEGFKEVMPLPTIDAISRCQD